MKVFKNILLPIGILGACLILAYLIMQSAPEAKQREIKKPILKVSVTKLNKKDIVTQIDAWGEVHPHTESVLTSEISGTIEEVSPQIRVGQFFNKGQTLITINQQKYQLALMEAEAEVDKAQMLLLEEKAKAQQATLERTTFGNNIQLSDLTKRIPQLKAAETNFQAARARLELAKINLQNTQIIAPFDGRTSELKINIGQYISANTPLAKVITTDTVKIKVPLSYKQFELLETNELIENKTKIETQITIKGDTSQQKWQGLLTGIATNINPENRFYTGIVIVKRPYLIENLPAQTPLQPGLMVEAKIKGKTLKDVYQIPESAIVNGDKIFIVKQKENGEYYLKQHLIKVHLFMNHMAIMEGAFDENDLLALTRVNMGLSGAKIEILMNNDKE